MDNRIPDRPIEIDGRRMNLHFVNGRLGAAIEFRPLPDGLWGMNAMRRYFGLKPDTPWDVFSKITHRRGHMAYATAGEALAHRLEISASGREAFAECVNAALAEFEAEAKRIAESAPRSRQLHLVPVK